MRKFFSLLLVFVVAFGLFSSNAEAKRFGGGRSFGMQRSVGQYSRPAYNAAGNRSQWGSALGGLVAGGLLASLFMGHGVGNGVLSWLFLLGVGFFVVNFLRRSGMVGVQPQPAGFQQRFTNDNVANFTSARTAGNATSYPAGFSADGFLRAAKVLFVRFQAAYDSKNLDDIRQFVAPEVFAEIQVQFQERGDALNETEVVTLNAELLDVASDATGEAATVRFSGTIREDKHAAAIFSEIWHFRKYAATGKWLVAGIQQD
jgi:predicted lipid-binding transport protein (Tim44 family)